MKGHPKFCAGRRRVVWAFGTLSRNWSAEVLLKVERSWRAGGMLLKWRLGSTDCFCKQGVARLLYGFERDEGLGGLFILGFPIRRGTTSAVADPAAVRPCPCFTASPARTLLYCIGSMHESAWRFSPKHGTTADMNKDFCILGCNPSPALSPLPSFRKYEAEAPEILKP